MMNSRQDNFLKEEFLKNDSLKDELRTPNGATNR